MAGLLFLGGLFTFAGTWAVVTAWWSWHKSRESATWPTVEGRVVETQVHRCDDSEGPFFCPQVRYAYLVMGRTYTGEQISFSMPPEFTSHEGAKAFLDRYPVGSKVTVFYNPNDPAEAVLSRDASGMVLYFILGLIFLPGGLMMLAYGLLSPAS